MRTLISVLALAISLPLAVLAEDYTLAPISVTEWKAVYGRIEARSRIPSRARLGGTLVSLNVSEGDVVSAGQVLARVVDAKIDYQLAAIDAQMQALSAQLDNARTELTRGEDLLSRGVTTAQRLDALRTQVDVLTGQIAAVSADRKVVEQQALEGSVLAPIAGRVLTVPVAAGAVVLPGEAVATIGGGGIFLRIAVPERHAAFLQEGAVIEIETATGPAQGTLARIYPLIENGRVVADVEVPDLPESFIDARVLVRLPVDTRFALMVPETAIITRTGIDFVEVAEANEPVLRTVLLGQRQTVDGAAMIEVLSGLVAGDRVVTGHE
ncbi:efflux RND transporter periplasmic adaptor subunit [Puniceibacterium sediminis]|uniref:RND family efflux transporter, MFP subunit n=1 Tax=Puniceibacterium sediminis TaxID=1608407 RepID=A0A238ZCQ5_9RHOB|nr:efflux RND transporter periplasmic adaptor subunit [Puniceibacterium sediminis]SNR81306.1 RND family efflux transporter, MFP subunit [Puniceibacterium sediminis]